jgi:hypothetical protein
MHYAGRQQMKHKRSFANLDRMSSVMTALIARHDIEPLGEQVDNLTLAFVAPLGANNCDYHNLKLRSEVGDQVGLG